MTNPDQALRNEARFRLAQMLAYQLDRREEGAILLREILDEQPDVARVRLELAQLQLQMGNLRQAEREFRAAQAAGLPPEVERVVRFFASAYAARRPFGINAELALAPDSNINRATRSETLETVIGDFTLSDDAQETSGVGASVQAQAWYRQGVEPGVDLLVRASARGRFYRQNEFDDYILSLQAGPQYRIGADRLNVNGVVSWRWFGRRPTSFSYGVAGDYRHSVGKRGQLRVDGALIYTEDRLSPLRSAERLSLAAGVDRAFSPRFGGGVRLSGARTFANDPGFSNVDAGIDAYAYREIGPVTAVLSAGYSRVEFDRRVFLYPERQVDDRFDASVSATFRNLRIGPLAPLIRLRYERSDSTVAIFDYDRVAAEFGVTAAY